MTLCRTTTPKVFLQATNHQNSTCAILGRGCGKAWQSPNPPMCIAVESALWLRKQVPEAMASYSFKTIVHAIVFTQRLQTHCEYYCLLTLASKTMQTDCFLQKQHTFQCEYCYVCTRSFKIIINMCVFAQMTWNALENNIVFAPAGSKWLYCKYCCWCTSGFRLTVNTIVFVPTTQNPCEYLYFCTCGFKFIIHPNVFCSHGFQIIANTNVFASAACNSK